MCGNQAQQHRTSLCCMPVGILLPSRNQGYFMFSSASCWRCSCYIYSSFPSPWQCQAGWIPRLRTDGKREKGIWLSTHLLSHSRSLPQSKPWTLSPILLPWPACMPNVESSWSPPKPFCLHLLEETRVMGRRGMRWIRDKHTCTCPSDIHTQASQACVCAGQLRGSITPLPSASQFACRHLPQA